MGLLRKDMKTCVLTEEMTLDRVELKNNIYVGCSQPQVVWEKAFVVVVVTVSVAVAAAAVV